MAADMEDASVVVDTCAAVEKFFDSQQRFPKRQNPDTDERRAEDALAQRWDRLLAQRASLGDALLTTYERLFMAADMEDASVVVDTCAAVEKFFDSQQRFPKRQSHWELNFPEIWESRRHKDAYLPADHIQKAEYRRIFERSPGASGMLACELCDFECDVREVFLQHLQEEHFGVEDGSVPLPVERCEEEYRKRLVFHERHSGWVEMGHGSLYSRHQLLPTTVLLHHSITTFDCSLRC